MTAILRSIRLRREVLRNTWRLSSERAWLYDSFYTPFGVRCFGTLPRSVAADQHVREAAARETHQGQYPILEPVPRAVFPQVAGLHARLGVDLLEPSPERSN